MRERRPQMPEDIVRRDALRMAFAGAAVGGITLFGFKPPERVSEYLFGNSNVRLIPGDHNTPESAGGTINKNVFDPYIKRGDISVSGWPQQTLKLVDNDMRQAKRNGQNYFVFCVDGVESLIDTSLQDVFWPWIPHPDLLQPNAYPQNIIAVNADTPRDFLTDSIVIINPLDHAAIEEKEKLIKEISYDYNYYTGRTSDEQNRSQILVGGTLAGELAVTGLAYWGARNAFMHPSRRRMLKTIFGAAAVLQVIKGASQAGYIANFSGEQSSYGVQKDLVELESVTDQYDFGTYLDLWTEGRTALAVQKVLDARVDIAKIFANNKIRPTSIPADIIYGSAHTVNAPDITTDTQYRKQVIQLASADFLTHIDTAIQTRYPALAQGRIDYFGNYRDQILYAAAGNLVQYTEETVIYPWGLKGRIVPPNQVGNLEQSLQGGEYQQAAPTVAKWVGEILPHFGLKSQGV